MCEKGVGTRANLSMAASHYEEAGRLGSIPSMLAIARLHDSGAAIGERHENARAWLVRAARAGDPGAKQLVRERFGLEAP